MSTITALIADDEPLLRERLAAHLVRLWPELHVVAEARNGREAVELFEDRQPAGRVSRRAHAWPVGRRRGTLAWSGARRSSSSRPTSSTRSQAFEQGAIDYLVKPFDEARLASTVQRLRQRLQPPALVPATDGAVETVLERLAGELRGRAEARRWLQWIKASVGTTLRLIPVEQVVFLRSDEKYTLVVWDGGEALIRKTIRELADELDPERFAQIHRSVIVNLARISQVSRGLNETAEVHINGRSEVLPVSRSYLHLFRQM